MATCESCSNRDGVIQWRGGLWCAACFETEAENRTGADYWISRVLGVVDQTEFSPLLDAASIDFEKRARVLKNQTVLKRREAEVRALKERGLSHAQIATFLGIEKGTVDTYSRRINDRIERVEASINELSEFS